MKITVLDDADEPRPGDVDATAVTEPGSAGTFRVRFTSVAPELTPLLHSLRGKA